jgi:hypothetical protein
MEIPNQYYEWVTNIAILIILYIIARIWWDET